MENQATPSGNSGEGRSYPEWTKSQLLLLLLWNKLQEAYEGGESELRVTIIRGGSSDAGVHVGGGMDNVSDEIPELKRGGEAVAVFERLRREGYILGDFVSRGPSSFETPVLYGLSTKGMIDIGKFPDPEARLATAIEAVHHAIEREPSIPETEKRDMLDTTEKMASLANNVGGLSTALRSSIELSLQCGACSRTWSERTSVQLPTDTAGATLAQLFRLPL